MSKVDWNTSSKIGVQLLFFLLLNTFLYNYHFRVGFNLYLSDLFLIVILAITLFHWLTKSPPHFHWPFLFIFLLLFLYYLFLAFYAYSILGNSTSATLGRFKNLFVYPLLFFSGLTFTTTTSDMDKYLRYIRIHILISILFGILSLKFPSLDLTNIYIKGEVVASRYFMLVTHATALLCCFIFIHELLEISKKSQKTSRSLFFMGISALGIMGTQNRSVLIVFIFMIILVFFYSQKAGSPIKERMRIYLSCLLLLLVAVGFFLVQSPLYEKFQKRIQETTMAFSGEGEFFNTIPGVRIGRTIAAFNEWTKSPIIGCGWGNQITEFKIYNWEGKYIRTNYGTPHNYYITILYQTGIIGFFIMMYFFYFLYKKIKPHRQLHPQNIMSYTFFIFYLGFMVFNIANTHFYGDPVFIPVFFFLLGAMVSYSYQSKHEVTS